LLQELVEFFVISARKKGFASARMMHLGDGQSEQDVPGNETKGK
jgi:hypothetical protein